MKVLVTCEFSGVVRDAFRSLGHEAVSCDFLMTLRQGPHYRGNVLSILDRGWDLMIAHPPCTHLACSGARHWQAKIEDGRQQRAFDFVMLLTHCEIVRICIENPVGALSSLWRKPDQIIQPYQFGDPESKATCLWLKNLPLLTKTKLVEPQWHKNPDGTDYRTPKTGKRYSETAYAMRAMGRSVTYQGIADAMAEQWGSL